MELIMFYGHVCLKTNEGEKIQKGKRTKLKKLKKQVP
jgi:hypothetical protein